MKTVVTRTLTPTKGGKHVRMEQSASGRRRKPTITRTTAGSASSAGCNAWWQGTADYFLIGPLIAQSTPNGSLSWP
jgi:hypothetical protein